MRLWHNPASPFARKVRIVARESGLLPRIEEIAVMVSPVNPNADLAARNPLVKIPALQTDDGNVLYDSSVICEYLDSLRGGEHVIPSNATRWTRCDCSRCVMASLMRRCWCDMKPLCVPSNIAGMIG
jgi:glutathione S-transferase